MTTYQRIVFMQGDEAEEPLRILDEHGTAAAIEHLAQWYNEPGEVFEEPASGDDDDTHTDENGYRLSWNTRIGYIGLEMTNN